MSPERTMKTLPDLELVQLLYFIVRVHYIMFSCSLLFCFFLAFGVDTIMLSDTTDDDMIPLSQLLFFPSSIVLIS